MAGSAARRYAPSCAVTAVCAACLACGAGYGFGYGAPAVNSLLYHFCHANVFHLLLNVSALFGFRPRWGTCAVAYVSASLASLAPFTWSAGEWTCGLSGFLFAAYARRSATWGERPYALLLCAFAAGMLPHVNWRIHVVSFLISYIYYRLKTARP